MNVTRVPRAREERPLRRPRDADPLYYLYGIVPEGAPAPPADLRGLDDRAVRTLPVGRLLALVSEVEASAYREEALELHMQDLSWVGARGRAHERVLTWYAERGPVVPLSVFSLHREQAGLRERIERQAPHVERLIETLRGRTEWGVKVWRNDAILDEQLATLSPSLREAEEEIESARRGRRFLLRKKWTALKKKEAKRVSAEVTRQLFDDLSMRSEREALIPLPPLPEGAAPDDRRLILHSAFLVRDDAFRSFHQRVSESVHDFASKGFAFELAGPLPPYRFATLA